MSAIQELYNIAIGDPDISTEYLIGLGKRASAELAELRSRLSVLEEENGKLREALGFYADKENWTSLPDVRGHRYYPARLDVGTKARAAMSKEVKE